MGSLTHNELTYSTWLYSVHWKYIYGWLQIILLKNYHEYIQTSVSRRSSNWQLNSTMQWPPLKFNFAIFIHEVPLRLFKHRSYALMDGIPNALDTDICDRSSTLHTTRWPIDNLSAKSRKQWSGDNCEFAPLRSHGRQRGDKNIVIGWSII